MTIDTPATTPAAPRAAAQPSRARRRWRALGLVACGLCSGLTGCADGPPARPGAARPAVASGRASPADAAPRAQACPSGLPPATRCLGGQDSVGAHDLIALPATDSDWSGVLVLHAHGGPELGPPRAERTAQDLQRWAVVLRAGHAWAGSTFRQGGVAVQAAAEDTERLRQLFVAQVATPRRTVLHGQSWGASVATVGAERFASAGPGGQPPYDALLLTSGVLAGGTRSYDVRLDLRVVYQQLCGNHPAADEPDYPLWLGLPPGAALTREALASRVDDCLGLSLPTPQRSPAQQQKLAALLAVVRVPERALLGHLAWATWHFQDIVQRRTGGGNPFGNRGVVYTGSTDDDALNRSVAGYTADPAAVAALAADTDPTGRIPMPVLTVHGIDDAVAFVELESAFRSTMLAAGTAGHLVQTFTADAEHRYLTDAAYTTLLAALLHWVDAGVVPTPASIAQRCAALAPPLNTGCRFLPDFQPAPLATRVPDRLPP